MYFFGVACTSEQKTRHYLNGVLLNFQKITLYASLPFRLSYFLEVFLRSSNPHGVSIACASDRKTRHYLAFSAFFGRLLKSFKGAMAIGKDDVKKVAHLARLGLNDEEIDKFQIQLDSIFAYFDKLNEVDVENVEETSQVTGLENISVADEIEKDWCSGDELLKSSPLPVVANQIKVKKVI